MALPHSSAAQRGATTPVGGADLQPGDLVFYGAPVSHVAMYLGDGMIIHSPRSGDGVKVAPLAGVASPSSGSAGRDVLNRVPPVRSAPMPDSGTNQALSDFSVEAFSFGGKERTVYVAGDGPAVIVIAECRASRLP